MDETAFYISVGVLGGLWLVLAVAVLALFVRSGALSRRLDEIHNHGSKLRVQKLKIEPDKNHAFQHPRLAPEEELSRRGYSMYEPRDLDIERGMPRRSHHSDHRQTSGPMFVEDLTRELEMRQQQQQQQQQQHHQHNQQPPPFLLHAIEDNKRRRNLANPIAETHQQRRAASETNPNFMY